MTTKWIITPGAMVFAPLVFMSVISTLKPWMRRDRPNARLVRPTREAGEAGAAAD